jgi:uncharacterized protein
MALARQHDVVVTQDYGLASMLIPKKCRIIHHDGYEYTETSIQKLIDSRHLSAKSRRESKRARVKSMDPFADETAIPFIQLLDTIIKEELQKSEGH